MEVLDIVFPPNHESAEVIEPGEEAFHFPSAFVSAQFSTVLSSGSFSTSTMGTNQLYTLCLKLLSTNLDWKGIGSITDLIVCSTSFTSAGLALAVLMAIGRP
jgi:hypothetical protein